MTRTYKDLSPEEIEYVRHVYHSDAAHKEKMDILCKKFDVGERTIRKWWLKFNLIKGVSDLPPQLKRAQERALAKDTRVVLVAAAQNKTSVNKDFLMNLKTYQDFIQTKLGKKTEIVIIPAKYRNPTSNVEDAKAKGEDWWEDSLEEYLFYGKVDFGDTLISADSRISPTAKDPLSGYEILANGKHLVLAHSKIHFKTLPRLRGQSLRTMSTTGYCTVKNYSRSKAGETAFENHSYGFVVVELKDDNTCYIPRNVKVTKEGSFIDIVHSVDNGEVKRIDSSLGLIWGDIHHAQICPAVVDKTHELINLVNPEKHVLHDTLDGNAFNPHETEDMFTQRLKIIEGTYLVEDEIESALDFVDKLNICCGEVFLSESNHDLFLDRHVNKGNWKNDLHNSHAYLKYALVQQTVDLRPHGNIFGYLVSEKFAERGVSYIKMGDSLNIGGYECGLHGDFGTNGSKGQIKGFSRLNQKMIHAHSHSPAIFNNVTCVGVTCKLEQHYNRKGFSSWAHAHSIVHTNNKNQLIVFGDDYSISSLI